MLAIAACAPSEPGPGIDVPRALQHVATLAGEIGERPGDTDASRRAAAYITRELHAMGLPVERLEGGAVDLPGIEVLGATYRHAHRVTTSDPDLIVRFGPPGKALLVMAHYDTVATSPGAIDNAAAVATVLELARVLAAQPPRVPVMLAFTANEEIGLVGAEALAERHGASVGLALALDLIGGDGELSLNGASTLIGRAELGWLAAGAERAGVVVRAPLAHRVVSRWWPQAERSDHGPFTRRGIRAIHLYNRGHDGDLIDRAYHSPLDTVARARPAAIDELGRVLVTLADAPLPAPGGDGFWLPAAANTVVPRWLLVAGELALLAIALLAVLALRPRRGWGRLALAAIAYAVALAATLAIERGAAGAHPARWLDAPRHHVVCELALIIGVLGWLGLVIRRVVPSPPEPERRSLDPRLTVAIAVPLIAGVALLASGAAELAWIWLVPAGLAALGARVRWLHPVSVLAQLLPVVLVLDPGQVHEAAWNGFLPIGMPLVAWIAALGTPFIAAGAWAIGHCRLGPLGAFALPMGYGLAILAGVLGLVAADPACSGPDINQFHMACR